MRIVLASLVAASLAGCATETPKPPPPVVVAAVPKPSLLPASQAPACAKPAEQAAFAMAALRSSIPLMAGFFLGSAISTVMVTDSDEQVSLQRKPA